MVQTPAPNPRRKAENAPLTNWTQRFSNASASRLHRKVALWTLASSAIVLSGSVSTRSEANPPGLSPIWISKTLSPRAKTISKAATTPPKEAVATLEPATVVQADPAVVTTAPTAANAVRPPGAVLQIDAAGAISLQAVSPQSSSSQTPSQTTSSQPATASPPPLSDAPLPEASPFSSQPQSQPISAPSGARGPVFPLEKAADLALPVAPSPQAAPKIAPLAKAVSRFQKPEVQPKMRISAIIGGRERQAQIAVTPKMTVGQALAAMGVSLAILDRVTPNASALVRDGLQVRITRIGSQTRTTRKPIAAEVRYQPTTKIRAGVKSTIQEAKAGTLEITERIWTRDGKITKREFISQRTLAKPEHKIVALGVNSHLMPSNVRPHPRYARALSYRGGSARDRMLAPADPRTFVPVKSFRVLATGYSAGPAGGSIGNWTATGVRCTYGAVAVDPRLIPLGSKLYVEGYGYGFACDVGRAIKGKHIDLAFDSPGAAMRHGKKQVTVWILGP